MTLERLALGCLLPSFDGLEPPDRLLELVEEGLGGVVLFSKNIRDREQVAALTSRLAAERGDVLIATDEEGGDVTRLETATGSSYPGHLGLGVVDDAGLTRSVAAALGSELAAAGINLDFAPVADVNTNPDNPVIGVRSFGADPALVARHVAAFVHGLQGAGVAACAKHFPGHGDTSADSHLELPVAAGELEPQLVPFRAAVEAGVAAVMTAHVVVPSLGSEPATINPEAIRLLREEIGFEGAVVSDALEMRAVAELVSPEEAAVRALEAGVDLLCLGHDLPFDPVFSAVVEAVRSGRISETRIGEATSRIGRIRSAPAPANGAPRTVVGAEAARRAVRVEGHALLDGVPLVVELVPAPNVAAGPRAPWLGDVVERRWPGAEVRQVGSGDDVPDVDGRPLVVVTQNAGQHEWQRRIVEALARPDAVVIETGLPAWRPKGVAGVVVTHGAGRASLEAAFEVLAGHN